MNEKCSQERSDYWDAFKGERTQFWCACLDCWPWPECLETEKEQSPASALSVVPSMFNFGLNYWHHPKIINSPTQCYLICAVQREYTQANTSFNREKCWCNGLELFSESELYEKSHMSLGGVKWVTVWFSVWYLCLRWQNFFSLFKQNKFETIQFSYKLFDLSVAQLQGLAKGIEYNRYLIRVSHCVELQMNWYLFIFLPHSPTQKKKLNLLLWLFHEYNNIELFITL